MKKENIDNLLDDILKDLDAIKTEDILSAKKEIKEDDLEETINNLNIDSNNFYSKDLDIESIISEITSNDKVENKEDSFYNNVDMFSLDEDRENISYEEATDDLSGYFKEEDTKDLLNQEYIAANNENSFLEIDEKTINQEVEVNNDMINQEVEVNKNIINQEVDKDIKEQKTSFKEPEYKEIKVKEEKEEMILKKDILFEKAYNDILNLVIKESKKSFDSLEEENKMYFSQLINKLEAYYKAKEDIFKDIQKVDKSIFDENIEII